MSRRAKRVTIEFLKQKVSDCCTSSDDPILLLDAIRKDLKVDFDFENWDWGESKYNKDPLLGYCTLGNGFTFLGMSAGGDWEYPVWFCVYWDGKRLRAYVPTKGNPWNRTTKRAFGNDDAADLKDIRKQVGDPAYSPPWGDQEVADLVDRDYAQLLEDLIERIEVKN